MHPSHVPKIPGCCQPFHCQGSVSCLLATLPIVAKFIRKQNVHKAEGALHFLPFRGYTCCSSRSVVIIRSCHHSIVIQFVPTPHCKRFQQCALFWHSSLPLQRVCYRLAMQRCLTCICSQHIPLIPTGFSFPSTSTSFIVTFSYSILLVICRLRVPSAACIVLLPAGASKFRVS